MILFSLFGETWFGSYFKGEVAASISGGGAVRNLKTVAAMLAVAVSVSTALAQSAETDAMDVGEDAERPQAEIVADAPVYLEDSASPFGKLAISNDDAAGVVMPELSFTDDGTAEKDYDKYYVFHRDDADFATAFADIVECDGYARGLASPYGYAEAPYPYTNTMAGAVGGAIANIMVSAIFGSGEIRRMRRVNMRTCMFYKGYDRHGLSKDLWEAFNFEEGFSSRESDERLTMLKQQALVASSGEFEGKALGL
ncbi:MAG: hypothetical protein R3E02_09585 [Blastomonas sp.]